MPVPAPPRPHPSAPLRVLVVCQANRTRSPLAAAMLDRGLRDRGVPAVVRSAGLLEAGREADVVAARIGAESGHDLSAHRSVTVTDELIAGADLVLAMTTAQLRSVVVVRREAWPRSFTLRELVARATRLPPDGRLDVPAWLAACSAGREAAALLGSHPELDVDDPTGGPEIAYREMARQVAELVDDVSDALAACAHRPAPARPGA